MKYILLTLLAINLPATELMTTREHLLLHNYNKKPFVNAQQKRKINKLYKIDKKKVKKLIRQLTKEDIKYIRPTHQGRVLKYFIETENGKIIILNGLNGEVLYQQK